MAFNFNWSPLIADTNRVREMLTSALNRSPKPPIIVDDILVNELNLGSKPPELEILEIGDLAEDKFRGIFKMSYTGDAYLTLKTKVQVNPLKTHLSTRPAFTSPKPLAACAGLTMPVQISLSDIRLSGFVILVFSKTKGVTLVFRNDPLESLKVSSTFDSIPFVRDFLQKTIESQLRTLFVEDLPAIIHRLSLKVFNSEHSPIEDDLPSKTDMVKQVPIDPFASPAIDAMDGAMMNDDPSFSLDTTAQTYATFSQKNLLRLAALSESQRTLSLFTPGIRDAVYRAWTSVGEHNDAASNSTVAASHLQRVASLSRIQKSFSRHSAKSSTASETSEAPSIATRPSLVSVASAPTIYTMSSGRPRAHRKKKHRVVDLRKDRKNSDTPIDDVASTSTGYDECKSPTGSRSTAPSLSGTQSSKSISGSQEREGELQTPPKTPERKSKHRKAISDTGIQAPFDSGKLFPVVEEDQDPTPRATLSASAKEKHRDITPRQNLPRMPSLPENPRQHLPRMWSDLKKSTSATTSPTAEGSNGGILEQAWMNKIASEMAKKIAEEKGSANFWTGGADENSSPGAEAPPAYAV